MTRQHVTVLIVGGGPAGLAAALYMAKTRPNVASEIAILEKARHPRFKTCAGGLIPKVMLALGELGLDLDVPAVTVRKGLARTGIADVHYSGHSILCTIIRRDEFDARLARAVRSAGVRIIENCAALGVERRAGTITVRSELGDFDAAAVIGADGSGSKVRASVFGPSRESIGRALMVDVPAEAGRMHEFPRNSYTFDFRCVGAGIRGYCWAFPCLIGGQKPYLNVGIYDQKPRAAVDENKPKAALLDQLRAAFPHLPLEDAGRRPASFKAHPVRWFERRDRFAADGVLLAGDAAGVDPLMGEGISCAFEHGKLAAQAVIGYLDGDSQAFDNYDRALHRGAIGRKLTKLHRAADWFYGPYHRWFFRLAVLSRGAQRIGVDWYNGEAHCDELATSALIRRWAKTVLFDGLFR